MANLNRLLKLQQQERERERRERFETQAAMVAAVQEQDELSHLMEAWWRQRRGPVRAAVSIAGGMAGERNMGMVSASAERPEPPIEHGGSPHMYGPEVFEQLLQEAPAWWWGNPSMVAKYRDPVMAALKIAAEVSRIAQPIHNALHHKK